MELKTTYLNSKQLNKGRNFERIKYILTLVIGSIMIVASAWIFGMLAFASVCKIGIEC